MRAIVFLPRFQKSHMDDQAKPQLSARTILAQGFAATEPVPSALVPPIHMSTTYLRDADNGYSSGYIYGRTDNPSVQQAENLIAELERAEEALLFGSGMAAATSVLLALDKPTHIIASQVMYWGFRSWLHEIGRYGHRLSFVETSDLDAVRAAVRPGETGLFWIETPSNPLWTITDIAAIAQIAHAARAVLCVDSTIATPIFTRPLALGADIVMHSATKYLNGHSDVVAGALACARDTALWARIRKVRQQLGSALGSFDAWLLMRGMRTLDVRVRAQAKTAATLASRLGSHPALSAVLYPGTAAPCRPRHRPAPDGRRLRRHAVDPDQTRPTRRDRGRRPRRTVEARHLARRYRKPDRAPRLDRRRRLALPWRPAPAFRRPRRFRRTLSGSDPRAFGGGLGFGAAMPFRITIARCRTHQSRGLDH